MPSKYLTEKLNLSHNVYCEDSAENLTKLPNYMIMLEKRESAVGGIVNEIIPVTCLTKAIEIVKMEKCLCTVYTSVPSKGKIMEYMCDMSYGIM